MNKAELIEQNIKLVHYIIFKHYPTFVKDEDIIQSGMLGLCKAAETFDPTRSAFSTYAGKCIRNEINQEFIRRKSTSNLLSLEYAVDEDTVFGDLIQGDDDISYNYTTDFRKTLSEVEQSVLELYSAGYDVDEISKIQQLKVQAVRKILRTVKLKWRAFNNAD